MQHCLSRQRPEILEHQCRNPDGALQLRKPLEALQGLDELVMRRKHPFQVVFSWAISNLLFRSYRASQTPKPERRRPSLLLLVKGGSAGLGLCSCSHGELSWPSPLPKVALKPAGNPWGNWWMDEESKVKSAWLSFPRGLVQPHPFLATLSSGNRRSSTHRSPDIHRLHGVPQGTKSSSWENTEVLRDYTEMHNKLLPSENAWLRNLKQGTSVMRSVVILDRNPFAVGATCSTVLPLINIKYQIQSFNNLFLYIWECFSIIHLSLQISTQE